MFVPLEEASHMRAFRRVSHSSEPRRDGWDPSEKYPHLQNTAPRTTLNRVLYTGLSSTAAAFRILRQYGPNG